MSQSVLMKFRGKENSASVKLSSSCLRKNKRVREGQKNRKSLAFKDFSNIKHQKYTLYLWNEYAFY